MKRKLKKTNQNGEYRIYFIIFVFVLVSATNISHKMNSFHDIFRSNACRQYFLFSRHRFSNEDAFSPTFFIFFSSSLHGQREIRCFLCMCTYNAFIDFLCTFVQIIWFKCMQKYKNICFAIEAPNIFSDESSRIIDLFFRHFYRLRFVSCGILYIFVCCRRVRVCAYASKTNKQLPWWRAFTFNYGRLLCCIPHSIWYSDRNSDEYTVFRSLFGFFFSFAWVCRHRCCCCRRACTHKKYVRRKKKNFFKWFIFHVGICWFGQLGRTGIFMERTINCKLYKMKSFNCGLLEIRSFHDHIWI